MSKGSVMEEAKRHSGRARGKAANAEARPKTPHDPRGRMNPWAFGLAVAFVASAAVCVTYWSTIVDLFQDWQRDDDYSVGQLVPLVALYLLWRERKSLRKCRIAPCVWGIAVVLVAQAGRAYGLLFLRGSAEYGSVQRYSLVLTIVGLVLLLGGRQVFRRVIWILLFLFLMVPLPRGIHHLINGPLQTVAATGAVFLLEVFGVTVGQEGNVIMLNNSIPLAVVDACSGLRMLTAFVVVTAAMAYMVNRPPWQKAVLLATSVPIAVACNVIRLCVTAILYLAVSSEMAEKFFHDFAGLTMMPLAVFILLGELWLLRKLVVSDAEAHRKPTRTQPGHPSGRKQVKKRRLSRPAAEASR